MYRKIGLFFLSLWLLFILTIIITIDIPICFTGNWEFIGIKKLLSRNAIPLISVISLLIGLYSYYDFTHKLRDAVQVPFKVKKIESIDYEHLTFLTTYIIPLVCFNFQNVRYQIVLFVLLFVIASIYVKTDLFYANPTLALLNFRIYKVNGQFKDGERNDIIIITRKEVKLEDRCDYIKLDNRIYYAKPKLNEKTRTFTIAK